MEILSNRRVMMVLGFFCERVLMRDSFYLVPRHLCWHAAWLGGGTIAAADLRRKISGTPLPTNQPHQKKNPTQKKKKKITTSWPQQLLSLLTRPSNQAYPPSSPKKRCDGSSSGARAASAKRLHPAPSQSN